MPLLRVTNLDVFYGVIQALHDATLHVERGEIVTLIGANGAGKTTLLRTISGLLRPQRGSIEFNPDAPAASRDAASPPPPVAIAPAPDSKAVAHATSPAGTGLTLLPPHEIVRLGISHVPEGRQIFANLSVLDNLMIGAYQRRDTEAIRADIDRVYTRFPVLAERRTQRAGTLSGGEQQMLAIGRALMQRPTLLLLDEPSLGLAPLIVRQIFQIIREINAAGTTVFLVEQNAHMALGIAHRAYVLQTGEIIKTDSAAKLLADPDVRKAYLGG